jgi:hypothetical protein
MKHICFSVAEAQNRALGSQETKSLVFIRVVLVAGLSLIQSALVQSEFFWSGAATQFQI